MTQLATQLLKHDWFADDKGDWRKVQPERQALRQQIIKLSDAERQQLRSEIEDNYFPSWAMDRLSPVSTATAIDKFLQVRA